MMRGLRLAMLTLICASGAALSQSRAGLSGRIRALIDSTPSLAGALWGIQISDAGNGEVVYQHNDNRLFVPASNTKLFTTALALERLGPNYRFRTTVLADREPDQNGAVSWLRLVGSGDANLSPRVIPYRMNSPWGDPLAAANALADLLVGRGLRAVEGGVIGDDSAFVWQPYPKGWAIDDAIWGDGAAVSALAVNDNTIAVMIRPGDREGDLARIETAPALGYYQFANRVSTSHGTRRIRIERDPGSRQVRIAGTIPLRDPGATELLGVDDPALFAALALTDALTRRGVRIAGSVSAAHLFPDQIADLEAGPAPEPVGGVELASRLSAPLIDDLRVTNKVSQNLHAEMVLRAVARAQRRIGSREAGLAEMRLFLKQIGIPEGAVYLEDGSGLTSLNLVTPAAVVALLQWAYKQPFRDEWLSLLPVGGEDGTLSARFGSTRNGAAARRRIRAKTGTLLRVHALSGYATRSDGRIFVFSILVNNYGGQPSEVRAAIDKICMLLVK